MRITSKGQVTIPLAIRKKSGLLPNTEAEFVYENGLVVLKPVGKRATPGRRIVARLRGSLKRIHRSTDELMALTRGED